MRMSHYTLLLFDTNDSVSVVRTISAESDATARKIAQTAQLAHAACAGYQLWRDGKQVAKTFPRHERVGPLPMLVCIAK